MKLRSLFFLALGGWLAGCASETPTMTYHLPLNSPGGKFSTLPPAVQNSVRAQVGSAEIDAISKETSGDSRIYIFHFQNAAVFPPLYVASDGSVLTPDLQVAVGATQDTIEASTAHVSNGVKFDALPVNVVNSIRSHAPTGEVDSVQRIAAGSDTFYDVFFKDPVRHPSLLISEDGKVVR